MITDLLDFQSASRDLYKPSYLPISTLNIQQMNFSVEEPHKLNPKHSWGVALETKTQR